MARDADEVIAGVGLLYVAPLGTTEPTVASAALPSPWREVGYTEEGATITTEVESEEIEVAEELEPIKIASTKRTGAVSFAMAQASRENLALALNLGANASNGTAVLEPPDAGSEISVMLALQTDQDALWLFRKAKNSGTFEMARAKTGKTLISVEFGLEKVTGEALFSVFPGPNGEV